MSPRTCQLTNTQQKLTQLTNTLTIARDLRHITRAHLAHQLGVHRTSLDAWENGTKQPTAGNLIGWAYLLNYHIILTTKDPEWSHQQTPSTAITPSWRP